jgi:hypothetical protein
MMQSVIPALRRRLRPNYAESGAGLRRIETFFGNAQWTIRFFYGVSLFLSYGLIGSIYHKNPETADFLWPVAWLKIGGLAHYFVAVPIVLFLVNCLVALKPEIRTLRILFFLFTLFSAAIDNSYGAMSHGWHIWIWVSVVLIFLPRNSAVRDRAYKLTTLSVIAYAQAAILLTYSMAGSLKLIAGIKALVAGVSGNFSVMGFSSLVADRLVRGTGESILGWFVVDHPRLGYVVFLFVIFAQTLSILIALHPRLHRAWGMLLILFHLGTALLLDIYFATHVLWLVIFFVFSPFRVDRGRWRGIARDWFE